MSDGVAFFFEGKSDGGGIGVPEEENEVGFDVIGLDTANDFGAEVGELFVVITGGGSGGKLIVGGTNLEVTKEGIAKVCIVVLTGMNHNMVKVLV